MKTGSKLVLSYLKYLFFNITKHKGKDFFEKFELQIGGTF